MFATLFTAMLNALRGIMRELNLETEIVLTEHEIKIKAVNPEETEKNWDDSLYRHGNLYFRDFANPIDFKREDVKPDNYELITSERYKTFMEQSLIDDMLQASKDSDLTLKQALIAIISTNVLSMGLIYITTSGAI